MKKICSVILLLAGLSGYCQQESYKIYFGNITNEQKVPKAELLKADTVAYSTEIGNKTRTNVMAFKVTAILKGTEFLEELSTSPFVTSRMKELFKKVNPGDKIYIENIVIKGTDGTPRKLSDRIAIDVIK